MLKLNSKWLALLTGALVTTSSLLAQDSGPLLNLLVAKGIVTDQEAEDLRAELVKDFAANSAAGKLNLSSSLTEFKLSGDVRLRHQVETQAPETATGNPLVSNERTRERFRFRFNGDAILQKGWSTGFALETAPAADSANGMAAFPVTANSSCSKPSRRTDLHRRVLLQGSVRVCG